MTTVVQIESAIEQLPSTEYSKLLAWMENYQVAIASSEALFSVYDNEEADAKA